MATDVCVRWCISCFIAHFGSFNLAFAVGTVVPNSGVLRFYLRCCDLYNILRHLLQPLE